MNERNTLLRLSSACENRMVMDNMQALGKTTSIAGKRRALQLLLSNQTADYNPQPSFACKKVEKLRLVWRGKLLSTISYATPWQIKFHLSPGMKSVQVKKAKTHILIFFFFFLAKLVGE